MSKEREIAEAKVKAEAALQDPKLPAAKRVQWTKVLAKLDRAQMWRRIANRSREIHGTTSDLTRGYTNG